MQQLADTLLEAPPSPPGLEQLEARARRLRRRRRWATGAVWVAAVTAGAVATAGLVTADDPGTAQVAVDAGPGRAAAAPASDLPPTSEEHVVASGEVDGSPWSLVAYEVAPVPGRSERRFCSELRSSTTGPQTCFPFLSALPPDGDARWVYLERHLGRMFAVVATDAVPDVEVRLDDEAVVLGPQVEALPVRYAAAVLPVAPYEGRLQVGSATSSVRADEDDPHLRAEGARMVRRYPALPGVVLEPLVSDDPAADGWVRVATDAGDPELFLSPIDLLGPLAIGADGMPDREPVPLYDARGRVVGEYAPGCERPADDLLPSDCGEEVVEVAPSVEEEVEDLVGRLRRNGEIGERTRLRAKLATVAEYDAVVSVDQRLESYEADLPLVVLVAEGDVSVDDPVGGARQAWATFVIDRQTGVPIAVGHAPEGVPLPAYFHALPGAEVPLRS